MSRIIVKNLPAQISSEKLKTHFALKGRITDIQLKYTPDGKFRKFAFIGYQNAEEASAALEYFNNTFLNTSKIKVEICAELGSLDKPKSWSKYASDSLALKSFSQKSSDVVELSKKDLKKVKGKKGINAEIVEKIKKHKDEPEFIEFLEVHGESSKLLLDSLEKESDKGDDELETGISTNNNDKSVSIAHTQISDLEYLKLKTKLSERDVSDKSKSFLENKFKKKEEVAFFTVKLRNLPYKTTKGNIKSLFKPLAPASIRLIPKIKGIAFVGFKSEKEMRQALVKNKTFHNGKQILITEHKQKGRNPEDIERWKTQQESLANEEEIAESGRIFIRNLAFSVSESEIQELFEKFGAVTEVIVPVDKDSRQIKGYGLVTFMMPEHAVKAYTELDGSILHGRMLHLLPGKPPKEIEAEDGTSGSYKAEKLAKLKSNAQSSHSWNTLFVDQNAVAELIAERHGVKKEDVLTGKEAAVRMALGETQIVAETKQFLEENGVKLDAFNQHVKKRSKTVILAKNLPANTTFEEIRNIFVKYGELGRLLLPPNGVTAIVEFLEPFEARSAFKRLAFTKFKYLPLYLEWAPENMFCKEQSNKTITNSEEQIKEEKDIKTEKPKCSQKHLEESNEKEFDIEVEPDTTIFIKNLKFGTNEDTLTKHFSGCGKIASVTVARKKDPSNPGKFLSMGYGFVQFFLKSSANEALKILQGTDLEGHRLELKRSNKTLQSTTQNTRKLMNMTKQTGNKILVRNIPFQASASEVRDLFKTFGEVKSIRIPKKMVGTGPHRGFGFVEFVIKNDAKNAMKALGQSTHLFGRRLVLEWPDNEEDSIENLRKKTAKHFVLERFDGKHSKKGVSDMMENSEEQMECDFEEEGIK